MPRVTSELPVDLEKGPAIVPIPLGDKRVLQFRKAPLFQGSLCQFYGGSYVVPEEVKEKSKPKAPVTRFDHLFADDEDEVSGEGTEVLIKLVKAQANNDLIEHEVGVLQELFPLGDKVEYLIYYRLVPKSYGGLKISGRSAHILGRVSSSYHTLAEVARAFPKGIDYRDVVWMIRRMLMGLGYAHGRHRIIHGAVLPNHVLLDLSNHAALILDWCFSTRGTRITAKHNGFDPYYAPEILERREVTPTADIFMMAKCAVTLLGGNVQTNELPDTVPPEFQKLLRECLDSSPRMRPDDAWKLHDEFEVLMKGLVGEPKFRRIEMPVTKDSP